MKRRQGASIALLISDFGYVDIIRKLFAQGSLGTVYTSAKNHSLIERYRAAGVEIVGLGQGSRASTKVRAILHQDGSGHVELATPYDRHNVSDEISMDALINFLRELDYVGRDEQEFLLHSLAKFWHLNGLGSLTVFPQRCAFKDVYVTMSTLRERPWQRYTHDLAFLLPQSVNRPKLVKAAKQTFGSGLAKSIYKGGGPFILRDSENMVRQALEKMGYLDGDLNADLAEAMLVFVNGPKNQYKLRKDLNALPSPQDTPVEVQAKLRRAFSSHRSDCEWRIAPRDDAVRILLRQQGFLARADAKAKGTGEVFEAMASYAKRHGLPKMKTYNGYVFRILRAMDRTPNKTGTVEFQL
ncbi:unnamed protein product [Symbiodinium natans]|uniref:Uncharacterized protein n=1 Tax=Symbiodinium natans TaxID=878477 RepID=A0A812U4Y8_9DINO|nr:unnamed protein product [Symbiodinium natans]